MQREMESGLDIKRLMKILAAQPQTLLHLYESERFGSIENGTEKASGDVIYPFQAGASVFNGEIILKGMDKDEGMKKVWREFITYFHVWD